MDKTGLARWRQALQEKREAKQTEEAKRLSVPPLMTIRQTFELMVFMRRLSEAADRQSAPKQ